MNKITLTDTGKKILTGTVGQPGIETQYWVGYFGLAYVPESASNDLSGYTTLVGPGESGDYIYNIWQGDLTGNGHTGSSSDFTRLTQYDANLSTNFRYAYDEEKGCNRLITWTTAGSSVVGEAVKYDSYDRIGYAVYEGAYAQQDSSVTDTATTSYTASGIPVPAPLLYLGDNLTYSAGSLSDMADSLGTDWPMTDGGYPMVTPDMRCYSGASVDGASGDDVIASSEARREDYLEDNHMANYKCFVSLSNYNKGHAQVSSEGYETDYQESCHNMSRVTKLFPIAQYEIADADPETKETRQGNANSIKYRLALDFGTDNRAYRDVLNFEDSDENEVTVFEENPNNSFKFNRIGIYAVPVSIRKFRKEGEAGCNHCQVEVDPDENPELVAIISLDEVMLSEDGSKGFTRWAQDFILNLQQVDPEEVPGCVRDVEVYYNMAENEAITWYQNQLLASAGLSEAVTTLGVDVAYLKSMAARPCSDCTTSQGDTGDQYASIYHTHDYLKNLVDAEGTGSVKGIRSTENTGDYSLSMGTGDKNSASFSLSIGATHETSGYASVMISPSGKLSGSGSVLVSNSGPTITDQHNSLILVDNGTIGSTSASIFAGASINGIGQDDATEITLDEFNASIDENGNSSLVCTKYCILSDNGGQIKVWNRETEQIDEVELVAGPTEGKYYGAQIKYSYGSHRPEYNPTIPVDVSAEFATVPPHNISNVISLGSSNGCASNSKNSVIIGEANHSYYTKLSNTFILGDYVLQLDDEDRFAGMDGDTPVQIEIKNVSVFGQIPPTILDDITSTKTFATEGFQNTHIFLDYDYAHPEMFGIFADPCSQVSVKNNYNTTIQSNVQFFPLNANKISPYTHEYVTTDTSAYSDKWANGLTEPIIKEAINSATVIKWRSEGGVTTAYTKSVPMIYTGGICLAGEANSVAYSNLGESNAGRIKLGSGVLPSAYIVQYPVSSWNSSGRMIIPTTIVGTTDCPYGGMLLGITDVQEVDGTMHIGLFRYPEFNVVGLTNEFTKNAPRMASVSRLTPIDGQRYELDYDADKVLVCPSNPLKEGDQFVIQFSKAGQVIDFPSIHSNTYPAAYNDLEPYYTPLQPPIDYCSAIMGIETITASKAGETWLMRQATYKDTTGDNDSTYMCYVPIRLACDGSGGSGGSGLTTGFELTEITSDMLNNHKMSPEAGKRYYIGNNVSEGRVNIVENSDAMACGDEFILVVRNNQIVTYRSFAAIYTPSTGSGKGDLEDGTINTASTWLFRKASYITNTQISPTFGFIATEIH